MERCASTCPQPPTPEGMSIETVKGSPRHRHLLKPGARCELEVDHEGAHRNGTLFWHAPPIVIVRGRIVGGRA